MLGCGGADDRTAEQRTCEAVDDLPDRDVTGDLQSDVLKRQLEDWQKVWEDAKDADPAIRDPVQRIVDDYAARVDGSSRSLTTHLEVELAGNELVRACFDVLTSTTETTT